MHFTKSYSSYYLFKEYNYNRNRTQDGYHLLNNDVAYTLGFKFKVSLDMALEAHFISEETSVLHKDILMTEIILKYHLTLQTKIPQQGHRAADTASRVSATNKKSDSSLFDTTPLEDDSLLLDTTSLEDSGSFEVPPPRGVHLSENYVPSWYDSFYIFTIGADLTDVTMLSHIKS
ncbi:hypothetical protein Glove_232g185 [Diversispora epigaea]|uniref:Uncharacterized protein n=1 Tax=Diversispora epigaea TaxID=1348612 RepID=A0A397IED1_9GLOM|nr:hypothetical protein Glove_232g185 [Diversispora epigaea]